MWGNPVIKYQSFYKRMGGRLVLYNADEEYGFKKLQFVILQFVLTETYLLTIHYISVHLSDDHLPALRIEPGGIPMAAALDKAVLLRECALNIYMCLFLHFYWQRIHPLMVFEVFFRKGHQKVMNKFVMSPLRRAVICKYLLKKFPTQGLVFSAV